mmetsp:Transcript_5339/g.17269  ORF Transcript_5339/g.17269 Transcript_5339/m.17269 type:complete len:224 (+) Transcript_5339:1999-2670(+)
MPGREGLLLARQARRDEVLRRHGLHGRHGAPRRRPQRHPQPPQAPVLPLQRHHALLRRHREHLRVHHDGPPEHVVALPRGAQGGGGARGQAHGGDDPAVAEDVGQDAPDARQVPLLMEYARDLARLRRHVHGVAPDHPRRGVPAAAVAPRVRAGLHRQAHQPGGQGLGERGDPQRHRRRLRQAAGGAGGGAALLCQLHAGAALRRRGRVPRRAAQELRARRRH